MAGTIFAASFECICGAKYVLKRCMTPRGASSCMSQSCVCLITQVRHTALSSLFFRQNALWML